MFFFVLEKYYLLISYFELPKFVFIIFSLILLALNTFLSKSPSKNISLNILLTLLEKIKLLLFLLFALHFGIKLIKNIRFLYFKYVEMNLLFIRIWSVHIKEKSNKEALNYKINNLNNGSCSNYINEKNNNNESVEDEMSNSSSNYYFKGNNSPYNNK